MGFMNVVVEAVRGFLDANLGGRPRIGVAVSGGVDSVVLFDILRRIEDVELVVLHYDHKLREGSGHDAAAVRALAEKHSLPFVVGLLEMDLGESNIEAQAREARYAFFRENAAEFKLDAVATAHHADDQAETVLFRLLRGSSGRGLAGIPPVRRLDDFSIIRPLLDFRRAELVQYARAHKLEWREDPTNVSTAFSRNRLRHKVIPFLQENVNSALVESLWRTAAVFRQEEAWLESLVDESMHIWKRRGTTARASVSELKRIPRALRARQIIRLLEEFKVHPNFELVESIQSLLGSPGRFDIGGEMAAWIEPGFPDKLIIGREPQVVSLTGQFKVANEGATEIPDLGVSVMVSYQPVTGDLGQIKFENDQRTASNINATALFDADAVQKPMVIRTRREGDRMSPFGMTGTKKLHDLFIDEKIAVFERDRWPLLCDESGVLWVIGLKQDERTRVTEKTRHIMRVDVESFRGDDTPDMVA